MYGMTVNNEPVDCVVLPLVTQEDERRAKRFNMSSADMACFRLNARWKSQGRKQVIFPITTETSTKGN